MKKIAGPEMGPIRAKKVENDVLGHFLGQSALVFDDFAYYG